MNNQFVGRNCFSERHDGLCARCIARIATVWVHCRYPWGDSTFMAICQHCEENIPTGQWKRIPEGEVVALRVMES